MKLVRWESLPKEMQTEEVKVYYDKLSKKKSNLKLKRVFDVVVSFCLLVVLFPLFVLLAIAIKIDSKGPVFYRQERVTQYNKVFRIYKFRSMYIDADKGSQITVDKDDRITRVGRIVRTCRLDEISQLINVLKGEMTLVGTRPEVPKYVEQYTKEMLATLLLPAGVTSLASIYFKDEASYFTGKENVDDIYVSVILPKKMHYNLKSMDQISLFSDIKVMCMTVFSMFVKESKDSDNS